MRSNCLYFLLLSFSVSIIASNHSALVHPPTQDSSVKTTARQLSSSSNDEPIEVSTVRSVDYREAAVAAALAVIVSVMRLLTSVKATTVSSVSTVASIMLTVFLTLAYAALAVILPRLVESQRRNAWEWFHAVCPVALLLPVVLFTFKGSRPEQTSELETPWNLTMSMVFREISIFGKITFTFIWIGWVGLAGYLQAYDSIVFYFATVLALEVGLTIPVALRRNERNVLRASHGNGCELQLGVVNSEIRGRLVRLTASGMEVATLPVDTSSFRVDSPSPLEHRLPFLSAQQGRPAEVDFGTDLNMDDFKVAIRGDHLDSETYKWVNLQMPIILKDKFFGDEEESEPLMSIVELGSGALRDEIQKDVIFNVPEHVSGIISTIARSYSPMMNMSTSFTWDDAMSLGKALSAQRIIGLQVGGYFADEGGKLREDCYLPLSSRLDRQGCIPFDMGWFGSAHSSHEGSEFSQSAGSASVEVPVTGAFDDTDIDLCSEIAAWEWLKEEYDHEDNTFSQFFSVWATMDSVNELYTIVEQQNRWARMWIASRNAIRIRKKQRIRTEPDGVCRLVDRVIQVAAQSGSPETLTRGLDTCFVVPTAAMALLVLVISANGVSLRRALECEDEDQVAQFRNSEQGITLLRRIGNLLWLSTFALPRNADIETMAANVQLLPETGENLSLTKNELIVRGLRLDMEAYNSSDGASHMNVYITALAYAVRQGVRKDDAHVGQALYDSLTKNEDMSEMCGKAAGSKIGTLPSHSWDSGVDSTTGAAHEAIRILLIRRLALVGLSTCGTLAAISLLSALV